MKAALATLLLLGASAHANSLTPGGGSAAITVIPQGGTTPQTLASVAAPIATGFAVPRTGADRARDRISIRDFLPAPACNGVADDSFTVAAAALAEQNTGRMIAIPGDCIIRMGGGAQAWIKGTGFVGETGRDVSKTSSGYGKEGGTFLITDTTKSPFLAGDGFALRDLIFNWPNQTEAGAEANGNAPIVYPAMIVPHQTGGVGDSVQLWHVENNQFENPYDLIDLSTASAVGHYHYDHNLSWPLHYNFNLAGAGGEGFITDNQFSLESSIYANSSGTLALEHWAAANSVILHVTGNGTTSTNSTVSLDGLRMSGNYALAMRYGIHVVGGTLNIPTLTGNSFDQVQTVLQADNGGAITAGTITGGMFLCGQAGSVAPCVNISGGAPDQSLTLANVLIPQTLGNGIVFNATGAHPYLNITGGSLISVGNIASGNPYNGIVFNAPNGLLTVTGLPITTTLPQNSTNAQGIVVSAALASNISNVSFGGFNIPLVYGVGGRHTVTGSLSYGTTEVATNSALQGPGASAVVQAGNNWDVGTPILSLQGTASTGSQVAGAAGLTLTAGTGNIIVPPSASGGLLQCASAPAGYLCANGTASGSAVIVK